MTFQPGIVNYTQSFGSSPEHVEVPHIDTRAPSSTDVLYPIGKRWINKGSAEYVLLSFSASGGITSANWALVTSSGGDVTSLTGDTGTALPTAGGAIQIAGTANQITTEAAGSAVTLSLPSTITTPGSLTTTTSLATTNGNLSLGTAGNKVVIATGSNASVGTSGAMSGTPGSVTVATTACSATAKIFYCRATTGGTPGQVSITAQDGTGFTLTSTGNETSTFNWWIINN
jgi:hypothetical protein